MKLTDKHFSRREFLKKNSLVGLGTMLSLGISPAQAGSNDSKFLHIKPRYHRWHVDPGVEWLESNTRYANLNWSIPLSQTALVLVDVWQRHYLHDTEERAEKIIQNKLIPLLAQSRQSGMNIIHAPSPSVAKKHPNWVRMVSEEEMTKKQDSWPPQEFRHLSGPYQEYQRPFEPRESERQNLPELWFHPDIKPHNEEAVIATGEELHRYCKKEKILFLLFAGFNTNACILSRDYGTVQMSQKGYQVILVRDCTTGMESAETQASLAQTNGAILLLEMFGQYSITSHEMIKGFSG